MKQFIWMLCGIFLSGLVLGTLSACGGDPAQTGPEIVFETNEPSASEAAPEPSEVPEEESLVHAGKLWYTDPITHGTKRRNGL